jgi:hypothetical protein
LKDFIDESEKAEAQFLQLERNRRPKFDCQSDFKSGEETICRGLDSFGDCATPTQPKGKLLQGGYKANKKSKGKTIDPCSRA